MSAELERFHQDFLQSIRLDADADGRYAEDAFFERFCEELVEAGELETADRAPYQSAKGGRVDGYGGPPTASDGTLSLIIGDYSASRQLGTLTATEMNDAFKRVTTFLTKALDRTFRNKMEESSPGFGLADMIAACWPLVTRIRLLLISDRVLSTRVDGRDAGEFQGVPVVYSVWDLGRLHRFTSSGKSREELVVDLAEHGGTLPALPAHLDDAGYEAYLIVIPGRQLASIYERWGSRLLEQNVRVFLQARGNVNKGIRNTLDNTPEMFFAYNNGITATAEALEFVGDERTPDITKIKNLQIVNGGQTTASIHAASRRSGADLSKVFVQMKLSIVPEDLSEAVVPKISEYANSQNKVSAADFFANHPYHVKIEDFSRRLLAPSADGSFRDSKWFYERARGQYQDARSNLSVADKRKFDLEFPKQRVFTKTDLAKFILTWERQPFIVSRGAQKNFASFAELIGKAWNDDPNVFNESYYRHAIAKAIVFRETEKLVTAQPWYEGGYRANIVTYAIAKLADAVSRMAGSVNLDEIWKRQEVPEGLAQALAISAESVRDILINPPPGHRNVTEWAKQQACWNHVSELRITWPGSLRATLITGREQAERNVDAVKQQRMLNGIESQIEVVNAGAVVWGQVKNWGVSKGLLSSREVDILELAAAMPRKLPSEKQCIVILEALLRLRSEGCTLAPDVATG